MCSSEEPLYHLFSEWSFATNSTIIISLPVSNCCPELLLLLTSNLILAIITPMSTSRHSSGWSGRRPVSVPVNDPPAALTCLRTCTRARVSIEPLYLAGQGVMDLESWSVIMMRVSNPSSLGIPCVFGCCFPFANNSDGITLLIGANAPSFLNSS